MFHIAFGSFNAGPYSFSTTVQFKPKPGILSGMIGPYFSPYEKSQLDWWMQNQAAFDVTGKTSDSVGNLYYIISGKDPTLVNDAIARVKPMAEKFSNINYVLPQAIKEAAGDIGTAAAKVTGFSLEVLWAGLKPLAPYIIGGIVVVGIATYTYGKGVKKLQRFAIGK